MKNVDRQQLVQHLVDLVREHTGAGLAPWPEAALRDAVERAVDLAAPDDPPTENRRVTILLSDLRGFTATSERFTAMEMVSALNRYLERMTEIVVRHGGSIDKFMGDAIMALFGAPTVLANDVEAALACAIEMQLAMEDINAENLRQGMAPLYMGIGVNTGEVVAGHLGSRLHREYTVIGDQVNLTSRVEAHSLRGQILLSESIYLQARDFIEIGDVNEVAVKGKKGTVRMYELIALPRHQPPLIAPKREMRNSPRVEVDMPLVFQVLQGKSVLKQEHVGHIADISYGGMYVVSTAPLQPMDDIKIGLALSLMGRELTEIYAKVLRVSEVNGQFRCPVEFTSIEPKAAQAIKEFVDSIVELGKH
jgi:adenylate cyclase